MITVGPLSVPIDLEAVYDAVNLVVHIHEKLRFRHGDEFRRLERRIDELAEDGPELGNQIDPMVGGGLIVHAPQALTDVIIEARRLGVIGS